MINGILDLRKRDHRYKYQNKKIMNRAREIYAAESGMVYVERKSGGNDKHWIQEKKILNENLSMLGMLSCPRKKNMKNVEERK